MKFYIQLALLFLSSVGFAQLTGVNVEGELLIQKDKAASNTVVKAAVLVKVPKPYHVNSNPASDDFLRPTAISIKDNPSYSIENIVYPKPKSIEVAGTPISVYEGDFYIKFDIRIKSNAKLGKQLLEITLEYQPCDETNCFPPSKTTLSGQINIDTNQAGTQYYNIELFGAPPSNSTDVPVNNTTVSTIDPNALPPGTVVQTTDPNLPPAVNNGAQIDNSQSSAVANNPNQTSEAVDPATANFRDNKLAMAIWNLYSKGNWMALLGLLLIGGLLLNLTPCVYPIIAITVGYFANQTEGKKGKSLILGLIYVSGIVLTYSVLGVVASALGKSFGFQFQSAWVSIIMALIMGILALSMFDVYELQLPASFQNKISGRKGYGGALTMGLLAGLAAAPCAGPVVIALMTIVSLMGNIALGFLLFFALGLGLGLPYLVLAALPNSVNKLPRSGDWMLTIKHMLGLVILGVGIFFLRPILSAEIYKIVIAGFMMASGIYLIMIDHTGETNVFIRQLRNLIGIIAVAVSVFIYQPAPAQKVNVDWKPFSSQVLEQSKNQKKFIVIDFTAEWCQQCKELEEKTFSNNKVASVLKKGFTLRVDGTNSNDPQLNALINQYGVKGYPTVILLNEQGVEVSRLTTFEPPASFINRLKAVGIE